MRGYKSSLLVLGFLAIAVFGLIWLLNRAHGPTIFSRGVGKDPVVSNIGGSAIANLPKNELVAPLGKDGSEIAVIADEQIRIVLPDPKTEQSVLAVIDAVDPQAVTWAKDRLYWVEKRTVKKSTSRRSETSYVLVEGSFGEMKTSGAANAKIQKKDVYRSDVVIDSLQADPSGQLLSFVEGERSDDRELFVYSAKTAEVRRIAQSPVSVAWSPTSGRFALVVASAQAPRPKTVYIELSANAEMKTSVDLPENFGGFGLVFLNESTVAGLEWSPGGSAKLQTVDLRSNTVTDIGEVAKNSDARLTKRTKTIYPRMFTLLPTDDRSNAQALLIHIADDVHSIYTIETREQAYLRIDEEPIGFIDSTTVLVQRDFDLFSVGLKSGIQTAVANDVMAAALR